MWITFKEKFLKSFFCVILAALMFLFFFDKKYKMRGKGVFEYVFIDFFSRKISVNWTPDPSQHLHCEYGSRSEARNSNKYGYLCGFGPGSAILLNTVVWILFDTCSKIVLILTYCTLHLFTLKYWSHRGTRNALDGYLRYLLFRSSRIYIEPHFVGCFFR